jgi:hypothetical protein
VTAKSNGDAADPKGFVLRIRSKEDAWVMIVADGQQIMDGTLSASAEKQVRAHDKVVVRVGNAAAVDISYNGKPVPTIGNANEVKSVTFTQQGMEE